VDKRAGYLAPAQEVQDGTAPGARARRAAGFILIAGFQVGLALGAPWGRAAWGGRQEILSPDLG
jgi:hypothetical protein